MNYNITLPERMILESLSKKSKDLLELTDCTGLQDRIVQNILSVLAAKNLIATHHNKYCISEYLNSDMVKELNDPENKKIEIQYVLKSTLDMKQKEAFNYKKVSMNDREKKIFNGHIYNLEAFIDSLDKNKKDEQLKNQNIIFWGEVNYGKVINHMLNF